MDESINVDFPEIVQISHTIAKIFTTILRFDYINLYND